MKKFLIVYGGTYETQYKTQTQEFDAEDVGQAIDKLCEIYDADYSCMIDEVYEIKKKFERSEWEVNDKTS